jgi:dephospho-CoA kinase
MSKLILGFTGPIASGKEVAKKYIENKYEASSFKFSTILRNILNSIDVDQNRNNIMALSTFLRGQYGEDILAKAIAKSVIESDKNLIVVDGIRRMSDIEYLKKVPGFVLIAIDAKPEIRYTRSVARNENPGDDVKTFAEFTADHIRETEATIPEVMSYSNYQIDNSSNLESLYQEIDKMMEKIQNN